MQLNILKLPPNRVRRNYLGGRTLDLLEGVQDPQDGESPEDWIASTTLAVNPGLPHVENEGLSKTFSHSEKRYLKDLFQEHPHHYLGTQHLRSKGLEMGFLTKFLDGSMRLHVQAHPTAEFAQKYLDSPYGKLETYVILGWRKGIDPYIRLGFQNPPSPTEWRRIVLEQDIQAMDACFDKIPVERGQVWLVPGGLPHALGEGLFVLEVMEPTDLVVRCEFEREGIIVPPQARFMNRDPDFALKIFDFSAYPVERLKRECLISPLTIKQTNNFKQELLIGPNETTCFRQERWIFDDGEHVLDVKNQLVLLIVLEGGATIASGKEIHEIQTYDRILLAAKAEPVTLSCCSENKVECIFIFSGQ